MKTPGEDWKIMFHERPRARGVPVKGIFATRHEAEHKRETMQAELTDAERARGAHFSLLAPTHPLPLKAVFKRKTPGLGDKRRHGG
jgi:hypothetical protein